MANLINADATEIRIGVVGLGKMGSIHLKCLEALAAGQMEDYYKGASHKQLRKLHICGLSDSDPKRLSDQPYPCFTDLGEMIDQTAPQLLIIATPTATHFDLSMTALSRGVHVLAEKPIVTQSNQIEQLAAVAQQNGCRLVSGHVERYNPVAITIVDCLERHPKQFAQYEFRRCQMHHPRIKDNIIVDKLIHDLDLSLCFFGPLRQVRLESLQQQQGLIVEASVSTDHENGVRGNLFVSWAVPDDQIIREVVITGTGGELRGDFARKTLRHDERELTCAVPGMIEPHNNQIKDELVDFIMHCHGPDPDYPTIAPLLSLEEVMASVRWIEQVLQSVEN